MAKWTKQPLLAVTRPDQSGSTAGRRLPSRRSAAGPEPARPVFRFREG